FFPYTTLFRSLRPILRGWPFCFFGGWGLAQHGYILNGSLHSLTVSAVFFATRVRIFAGLSGIYGAPMNEPPFHFLAEHSHDLICVVGPDHVMTYVARSCTALL